MQKTMTQHNTYNKPTMHPQTQTLTEIIKSTINYDLVSIILFGSAATGNFKKESDIDVLIIVKEYNEPVCKEYWRQIKKEGYQMLGIPIDPIFAEEKALDDITSSFYLDVIADGKVIYGKDVLDRTIFKRYNISPIITGGVRIGWRVTA
jgi:predicted nucleotidyltransferase